MNLESKFYFLGMLILSSLLLSCSLNPAKQNLSSRMFHPAMMEGFNLELGRSSMLTNLESLDQNTGGGGCSVCAK